VLANSCINEAPCEAPIGKGAGLIVGPSVAGVTSGTRPGVPFDGDEVAAGPQDSQGLTQPGLEVGPVVDRGDRPQYGDRIVGEGEGFGRSLNEAHPLRLTTEEAGYPQHDRSRIHPGDRRGLPRCPTGGGPGSAAHVYDGVFRPEPAQLVSQTGVALPTQDHARSAEKPGQPGEARVVGVVVGCTSLLHLHSQTLTVEPRFKSSGDVPELLSIGEVAQRGHVPTSTVRYYERRGLLAPDGRQSGQRRYRTETLRRLVFIGLLQDAGLTLDEIDGILRAATVTEWKAIARRRLDVLDQEIVQLKHSRDLLAAALGCRFDHPATDCQKMGAEIDHRLSIVHER